MIICLLLFVSIHLSSCTEATIFTRGESGRRSLGEIDRNAVNSVETEAFLKENDVTFSGEGINSAICGRPSCFVIMLGKKLPLNLTHPLSWRIIIKGAIPGAVGGNFLSSGHVKFSPWKKSYDACYIIRNPGNYTVSAFVQRLNLISNRREGEETKVMDWKILAESKGRGLQKCKCSMKELRNGEVHGYWNGSNYMYSSCEVRKISARETISCLGKKTIAVFADYNLKVWLSHFISFLGRDKIKGSTPNPWDFIRSAYELSWAQTQHRPFSFTQESSESFAESLPFLDLDLCQRAKVLLYGTGYSSYAKIAVSPPCHGQSGLDIWLFHRGNLSGSLFPDGWVQKKKGEEGRPWLTFWTRFDLVITSTSLQDLTSFETAADYGRATRTFLKQAWKWVKWRSSPGVVWLSLPFFHSRDSDLVGNFTHKAEYDDGHDRSNARALLFDEEAKKAVRESGGTFLDLRPITAPRSDVVFDAQPNSKPVHAAVTQLLLSAVCPPLSLVAPPGKKCFDVHPQPLAPPPATWAQRLDMAIQKQASEVALESESFEGQQQSTVGSNVTSNFTETPTLPYGRHVFLSLEDVALYKKEFGGLPSKRRVALTSDLEGPLPFLPKVLSVKLHRSSEFKKGLEVRFERVVHLEFMIGRYILDRCMWYRVVCANGGIYTSRCPFTGKLQEAIASGVTERCDRWCPAEQACFDLNVRPGNDFLKVLQANPTRLYKSVLTAHASNVLVSNAGDVYANGFMIDTRGWCFGYASSKRGIRVDFARALANPHKRVFIATSYRSSVYSVLVEGLTRMMPFYDKLLADKTIKIHVRGLRGGGNELPHYLPAMMAIVGISKDRLICGDALAGEAIMTDGVCKAPFGGREAALLQKLQRVIHSALEKKGARAPAKKERYILLLLNKWHRRIADYEKLVADLKAVTKLRVKVHHDKGFHNVTMLWPLFYGASAVIGTHGNALTHVIACRRGTPVLEFMQPATNPEDPAAASIQFQVLSTSVGLPHHFMAPSFHEPLATGEPGDSYFLLDRTIRVARKVKDLIEASEGKRDWREKVEIHNYTIPRT